MIAGTPPLRCLGRNTFAARCTPSRIGMRTRNNRSTCDPGSAGVVLALFTVGRHYIRNLRNDSWARPVDLPGMDPFEVLGVARDATAEQVEARWR